MTDGPTIEVVAAGTLTTVQEWPGRRGFWEVGVPPSGPMDDRSFRLGNRLVGNDDGAAGLEVTVAGPTLRFAAGATVAVTGAPVVVEVDGTPVAQWTAIELAPGATLRIRQIRAVGMRAYVLVAGGIDSEVRMGSRAAFPPGGYGQPVLASGDALAIGAAGVAPRAPAPYVGPPRMRNRWTPRVITGPQGAPDIVSEASLRELLGSPWTVHHHSDRTGIRLEGPTPDFTRADGGDAGLHPSNILDSAYGVGTIMLAGEMAVVVGVDGPSLGGFAAFAQIIEQDLWMLGQMRAGDTVSLCDVTHSPTPVSETASRARTPVSPVLDTVDPEDPDAVTFRRAGERALLVEFGQPVLDLRSRVRAHLLQQVLREASLAGVTDLTPGVRSLHVQFDPHATTMDAVLDAVARLQADAPDPARTPIDTRTVEMPLTWRDPQAMLAVERYMTTVCPDAPWCPDNIEFIRRINGLADEDAVRRIVYDASYLVLGLGDVYLGAPVALPLDPRHRLVTTKYTPVRTWTPPNAVGIGGAFLCVYGMEGPGGYQLVGRTAQIWQGDEARLRHFDALRFVPVSKDELSEIRADPAWEPTSTVGSFSLGEHDAFLAAHADEIAAFRAQRVAAFDDERRAWEQAAAGAGAR